jgi:mannan endo-1,4-beta-mannosidase
VKRAGTQFMLDGHPFYITGANTHYLAWGTDKEVDHVLDDAVSMNFNVIRTFISVTRGSLDGRVPTIWEWDRADDSSNLGMNGVYFVYWDAGANRIAFNDGANGLQRIDHLIVKAKQRNLRLLFSLMDFYDYTGGAQQMRAWYGSRDRYTFFFQDARTRADYKAWVHHLLTRVNPLTGVAYKDEPAIFGWDLMNEPQFSSVALADSWIREMSAYVKSIDNNHLVGSGSEGFFGGKSGSQPLSQTNIETIDFGTWHVYPVHHRVSPDQVVGLIRAHCEVARQAQKPVLMEEFAYGTQHADQAAVYKAWLDTVRDTPDCAGWLVWRLVGRMESGAYPRDHAERFNILNDNSSTAQVLREAARLGRRAEVADAVQPDPPTSRFALGVDMNGTPLVIDGNQWHGYDAALRDGLTVRGAAMDTKALPKQPDAPPETAQMLDTLVYSADELGTLSLTQAVPNGNYSVYLWVMENYQSGSRSFDLVAQGQTIATGLGDLPLNHWTKYGPYPATVTDGVLRLDLKPQRGRAILMGFALYTQ